MVAQIITSQNAALGLLIPLHPQLQCRSVPEPLCAAEGSQPMSSSSLEDAALSPKDRGCGTRPSESLLASLTHVPIILLSTTCLYSHKHLFAAESLIKLPVCFCSAGYAFYLILSTPCTKYLLAPRAGYLPSHITPILTQEGKHSHSWVGRKDSAGTAGTYYLTCCMFSGILKHADWAIGGSKSLYLFSISS